MKKNATIFDACRALEGAFPDGFDERVRFEIDGLGSLILDSKGARVGSGEAECVLTADAETFANLLSRESDPSHLYFSGRLQVQGNLGTAIRLGQQV